MAKVNEKYTTELKDTLKENDHITDVHFTSGGHHYFNVHEHTDGKKYGQIHRATIINNKTGKKEEQVAPNIKTLITETVKKEDILNDSAK